MRPLPPAPNLPDLAEVLHKATIEGVKQGIAWIKKDKGKHSFVADLDFFGLMSFVLLRRRREPLKD